MSQQKDVRASDHWDIKSCYFNWRHAPRFTLPYLSLEADHDRLVRAARTSNSCHTGLSKTHWRFPSQKVPNLIFAPRPPTNRNHIENRIQQGNRGENQTIRVVRSVQRHGMRRIIERQAKRAILGIRRAFMATVNRTRHAFLIKTYIQ